MNPTSSANQREPYSIGTETSATISIFSNDLDRTRRQLEPMLNDLHHDEFDEDAGSGELRLYYYDYDSTRFATADTAKIDDRLRSDRD